MVPITYQPLFGSSNVMNMCFIHTPVAPEKEVHGRHTRASGGPIVMESGKQPCQPDPRLNNIGD